MHESSHLGPMPGAEQERTKTPEHGDTDPSMLGDERTLADNERRLR